MSLREEVNPGANQPNSRRRRRTRRGNSQKKIKWVKHYSSDHRILLVGEGDFSFSLSLARAFGDASNIVATSLDSYDVVIKKYKEAKTNLENLHSLGAGLLHELDALQMKLQKDLQMQKFDRIIFNFPHAGFLGLEDDQRVIMKHRNLVCGFFKNASGMLCPKGEVHVAHKTSHPFASWNIEELATQNSLTLLECIKFKLEDYSGYNNKRGEGKRADEPFPLGECSTYKFVLFSQGSNSSKNDELCNCGPPLRRFEYTSLEKKNPNTRFKDGLGVRVSKEGSVITCQRCFEIGHNNKTCNNEPPKIAKKKRRRRKVQEGDMETEGSLTVGGQSGNGKNEFVLGGTYPGFKASVGLGVSNLGNHASKGWPKSIPKWWGTGVTNCPGETFLGGRDSVPCQIGKQQSIELAKGTFEIIRLQQRDNVVAVLARVSDQIQWPLAKDEAAIKLDDTHYFFTPRVPSNNTRDMGVLHPEEDIVVEDCTDELDRVLGEYSAFTVKAVDGEVKAVVEGSGGTVEDKAAGYWTTLAPNVEDYSSRVSRLIASGSGQLIKWILWCGDVTVDRLKWGNEFLKLRMKSGGKSDVSPQALMRMKRVKKMTKMSENVAKGLLSGFVKVSGFFTGAIVNSVPGKKFFNLLPGEIVLASLDGFNKVFDAVEVAGRNVMSTTSTVMTDLVSHKHGEDAAKVTSEAIV